jgi:hypothetical protein
VRKGGNEDGVSHPGDAGMDDDALAAALETHFAPFSAGLHSVPVPVPRDDPDADRESEGEPDADDGGDPEVTAITRRLDRTGDTLGAIDELEQLLIERTGQIPVVTPELLAAHSARLARPTQPDAVTQDAAEHDAPEPDGTEPDGTEPDAGESVAAEVDWSIPAPVALDPAPGFSDWVDPAAIAAAFDAEAGHEFTDVSTKVFAVFSADRAETERPAAAPGATSAAPEPAGVEPRPLPTPVSASERPATGSSPTQAPAAPVDPDELDAIDELDGIDDLAEPRDAMPVTPHAAAAAPATPAPAPTANAAADERAAERADEPPARPRRRFWPFGRR